MPQRRPVTPTALPGRVAAMLGRIAVTRWPRTLARVKNRMAKHPAQTGQAGAIGQHHHPAMHVSVGQATVPQVFKIGRRVGVVVAMNKPHPVLNRLQGQMQGLRRLDVAQQHHRAGVLALGTRHDVPQLAMRVAHIQNRAQCHQHSFVGTWPACWAKAAQVFLAKAARGVHGT